MKEKLNAPFAESDIEWRIQSSGLKKDGTPWALILAYVSARAVEERLDEVFGVLGWQSDYTVTDRGILCHLKVWNDKEWITKTDGAPETEFESFKGGISGALKRAASAGLGIGRYLYGLETTFAQINNNGKYYGQAVNKDTGEITRFKWNPPQLPESALPKTDEIPEPYTKAEFDDEMPF